jgi:TPR repeat protein
MRLRRSAMTHAGEKSQGAALEMGGPLRILAGLAMTFAMAGTSLADPLKDGTTAIRRGDYTTALRLVEPLAEAGVAEAEYDLGFLYAVGQGVRQDLVRAHMWLSLAAAQGYTDAVSYRDRVAAGMTAEQIAEAERLAEGWRPAQ